MSEDRIEKLTQINNLLDVYGPLLTERRREALRLCYEEDLSLSEIAALSGTTRQAAHDQIRCGERQLLAYEAALHIVDERRRRQEAGERLRAALLPLLPDNGDRAEIEALIASLT